jgi:hypothetical protein
MKILFHDIIQKSDAPPELRSPALSETLTIDSPVEINFDRQYPVNSVGIGYTDGVNFIVTFNDVDNTEFSFQFSENGLYKMPKTIMVSKMLITTDASFIGRIGAGLGVHIPTAVAKEPTFASTSEPRVTLSGQVIPGAGGYNYRTLSLDSRYKITEEIINEIKAGYFTAGIGYPYFIDLADESYKLPFSKFYANEKNQRSMTFQSGVRRYLYSRKFEFEERF